MTNRLTELKNSACESAGLIGAQLQSVESSVFGAITAIVIAAFISERVGLILWVPASFLLVWVLLVLSLIASSVRARSRMERDGKVRTMGALSEASRFLIVTRFKNTTPLLKSIGAVFSVSFLLLLVYQSGVIGRSVAFSIGVPLASSLFFLSLPILTSIVIAKLDKTEPVLDFTGLSWRPVLLIGVLALVYVAALLVLPVLSFLALRPVYGGELSSSSLLLVVVFLQAIAALAFMNYFSASLVRREMSEALLRLSAVHDRIEGLLSNQSISDDVYVEVREQFEQARRYSMAADDTLLINYYSIRPNPSYVSRLAKR